MGASIFDEAKTIAAGGLRGPGGPGWCPGEVVGAKSPNNLVFFQIKYAKTVNVRVNIG